MNLKSLKLAGFKSFVDVTTIPVRSQVNAVVGPNGCGKSNIVDAIRWVIGEVSAKQLRGHSMTDVIFNGTSARKPVSKALVELIFDNQEGRIGGRYTEYSELAIRRELTRDGQSSYFINGSLCRRRDIVDIFLGTGLGPRSYAIIEQGVISRLVEAKPDEFRIYLEEAAGISKYKERRRDTESRMHRTQENLERVNDLCEELAKQLSHLKRQAKAAERYQQLKEEQRHLHAQTKGLQWQALADQISHFEERIHTAKQQHEEQEREQHHLEANIKQAHIAQTEAQNQHNEVQKHYYALGADIARFEQNIKDKEGQIQRWQYEQEEAERLWQELEQRLAEYEDQIQEITEEIAQLSPQTVTVQETILAAQQALEQAEADMNVWQEQWEVYQRTTAKITQNVEVARTNISHYQQQVQQLESQRQRALESSDVSKLEHLEQTLEPMNQKVETLNIKLEQVQSALNVLGNQILAQRQQNTKNNEKLNQCRQQLQKESSHYASLKSLQEAALSGDAQANVWLDQHNLIKAQRLGTMLRVNPGWEHAVETVLGHYFDAVCVDDVECFVDPINHAEIGSLTLLDRCCGAVSVKAKAASLADQVQSDWPIASWLAQIYIADNVSSALTLRGHLSPHESVITKEGLWLGVNWIRRAKPADQGMGFLTREKSLKKLSQQIVEQQNAVSQAQAIVDSGQRRLAELEQDRDSQHKNYQLLSQELIHAKAELSAQRSRYDQLQQQKKGLQEDIAHYCQQIETSQAALQQSTLQFEQFSQKQNLQINKKDAMIADREQYQHALYLARKRMQNEQKKADELEVRLESNNNQLKLLKQTVSHSEQQMQQLNEQREHLTALLSDTKDPLSHLKIKWQEQLNKQVQAERSLEEAKETLDACHQQVQQLEAKRHPIHVQMNNFKDQLQSIQIECQAFKVRQMTIQEQLMELGCDVNQVLKTLPAGANREEWEQLSEAMAQKIKRLGPINLAAIEECEQLNERKVYLDQQQADLCEALEILQNAIHKIDQETRQKFKKTYDTVNQNFKSLFPQIFGGGTAYLDLEAPDLLTSGIVVRAQPPGKRNSTLHVLSGGEKALTAIALVFSLFQLNPAPFCILDEVDAPLDDINVGRFCQLVREMSPITQFIVISHNKATIEMADYLMGVTMQEAGVSRIVSVDMEAAIAMAQES